MPLFKDLNGDIHYEIGGKGPTLVLLNGIMMSTKSWELFKDPLSELFTLIRVDFYDQGLSSSYEKPYDLTLQRDMLNRLFDHLKLTDIHLVGISYGASVAMQVAVSYPEKISSLMIFNGVAQTTHWLKDIGRGWNEVAQLKNGLAYYHSTIPYIYSDTFYNANQDWMNARKKVLVEIFNQEVFLNRMIRLTKSAESHDVLNQLSNLKMPVAIIASDKDVLTPPSEQIRIKNQIKHAQLSVFEGVGHASMYEVPQLFISTITGFILAKKVTLNP